MSGPGLSIVTAYFQDDKGEVKKGWVVFLEWVNRKWSDKMVKSSRLVSDCITVSDEAFAILIAKGNLNYWIDKKSSKTVQYGKTQSHSVVCILGKANSKNEYNSDDELEFTQNHGNDNEGGNEENETDAFNSAELGKYFYSLCSIIKNLRAEDRDHSWDHSYKDAIAQTVSEAQSKTSSGIGTISSKSIAALDISKSDDQDNEFVECVEW
jgi:hypothetical protein